MSRAEPNKKLFKHWKSEFRSLPGFKRCVCLRAPRTPDGRGHPDFLILKPGKRPRLGIIECEGHRSGMKTGASQLEIYLESFRKARKSGRTLRDECIETAFDEKTKRGRRNIRVFGSMNRWLKQAGIKDKKKLARILSKVRRITPILLFYPGAKISREDLGKLQRKRWIVGKIRNKGNWLRRSKR